MLIFRNEELGNFKEAEEKYKMLITLVPSDPTVLQRLGAIYARLEDDILAHQHYMEVCFFIYLYIFLFKIKKKNEIKKIIILK